MSPISREDGLIVKPSNSRAIGRPFEAQTLFPNAATENRDLANSKKEIAILIHRQGRSSDWYRLDRPTASASAITGLAILGQFQDVGGSVELHLQRLRTC